jgi:hypothetical protein
MTTARSERKPAWQAEVKWGTRSYTTDELVRKGEIEETADGELVEAPEDKIVKVLHRVRVRVVHVFRTGCQRIRFLVNHREGREVTFTDPRERNAGTAGTTGIWGTLPALPAGMPRPLSVTAFRAELGRLVGAERAEEVIRSVTSPDFF